MLESNSNRSMWLIGTVSVVTAIILLARPFFNQAIQDILFKVQTPDQIKISNVGALKDGWTPNGANVTDNSISYSVPAIDHPTGTSPWNESEGGLAVYNLGLQVPYKSTLTYTFQLYIKSDSSVKTHNAYFNISNHYSDGTSASGDDLDAYQTTDNRKYTVNGKVYPDSEGIIPIPTNQWTMVSVTYTNDSLLKKTLTDDSSYHVIDATTSEGAISATWRNLAYGLTN